MQRLCEGRKQQKSFPGKSSSQLAKRVIIIVVIIINVIIIICRTTMDLKNKQTNNKAAPSCWVKNTGTRSTTREKHRKA